ncbi:MAG: ribose-5-phosphate isomerase RpiA, partial [Chloroflexota bacterium]
MDRVTELKKQVGEAAAAEIKSNMAVGLGSGSTAIWMVRRLGEMLQNGEVENVIGLPSSERTAKEARRLNIPLTTLSENPILDLAIDGADEIDPALNLIKGGGGALLREKIVAQASKRFIIVADDRKLVDKLGSTFKLPVEVIPFGHSSQRDFLQSLGAQVTLRTTEGGDPFTTDSGNYIYDCDFGPIDDVPAMARRIVDRAGVVEHGFFIGMAERAIVASADGIQTV